MKKYLTIFIAFGIISILMISTSYAFSFVFFKNFFKKIPVETTSKSLPKSYTNSYVKNNFQKAFTPEPITPKEKSSLCQWYDAAKPYGFTTYKNGVELKVICEKYDDKIIEIEKVMKSNNHAYIIEVYDCTEFSKDFIKNIKGYNAKCVFGKIMGMTIQNGRIVQTQNSWAYLPHTWIKVSITKDIVMQVDPAAKAFVLPIQEKDYVIINEGQCV